jgi:hypothetical protein
MVDRYGKFDVTAMPRTAMECVEVACGTWIVHKCTQRSIMKTTRYWMEQGVKSRWVGYALHREGFDILRSEEPELNACDSRRNRLRGIHDR